MERLTINPTPLACAYMRLRVIALLEAFAKRVPFNVAPRHYVITRIHDPLVEIHNTGWAGIVEWMDLVADIEHYEHIVKRRAAQRVA